MSQCHLFYIVSFFFESFISVPSVNVDKLRGRDLILQPASRGRARCSGFTFEGAVDLVHLYIKSVI